MYCRCPICDGNLVEDIVRPALITDRQDPDIQALVLSAILYAAETWTVRAGDARIVESIHMKCERQILGVRWQDHVRNVDVANQTGLSPVMDHIVKRRNSIFGHIASTSCTVPVHRALCCQVDLSRGRFPDISWKRCPAVRHTHRGVMQRSSMTTHERWRRFCVGLWELTHYISWKNVVKDD